jgi:hypothetical protein
MGHQNITSILYTVCSSPENLLLVLSGPHSLLTASTLHFLHRRVPQRVFDSRQSFLGNFYLGLQTRQPVPQIQAQKKCRCRLGVAADSNPCFLLLVTTARQAAAISAKLV